MTTTFRVFVSSTFDDFHAERAALRPVFARLSAYCEPRGAKFQSIDLRWGISDEAAREQRTLDLCLDEIARCKQLSPRPNFICLLGDRYGWRPLPRRLRPSERDMLAASPGDRALLDRWYRFDEHALDPELVLTRGDAATAEWDEACVRIREIFTAGLAANPNAARLGAAIERAATHHEIAAGILSDATARAHALAYERRIPGVERYGDMAARYLDREVAGLFFTPARDALARLKAELVESLGDRYRRLDAALTADGPDPAALTAFTRDIETRLQAVIEQEVGERERRSTVEIEREVHALFAGQRGHVFLGRGAEQDQLRRYALDASEASGSPPLLVTGPGGIGKSALL